MLLEDTDCSVEPGTTVFRILGLHDKFTFTCSFLLVILSIWVVMSREIAGPRPPIWPGNLAIPALRVVYGRAKQGDSPRFSSFYKSDRLSGRTKNKLKTHIRKAAYVISGLLTYRKVKFNIF